MGKAPKNVSFHVPVQRAKAILVRYWPLFLAVGLFLWINTRLFKSWWEVWRINDSYFSHGPLIPFIVLYMIWANKKRLAQTSVRPNWTGVLLLVPSLAFFVLGNWLQSASLNALTFMMMIFGMLLLLLGSGVSRLLFVPIIFIATMIPVAPSLLDTATSKLQLQSAAVAAKFIEWSGYTISLKGATILSNSLPEPLIIGAPCSGLRTLISLLTFTFFFVYMLRTHWWKKLTLIAIAFPLSVLINSLRITMIGYAGFWTGSAEAMHSFHDYSGYIGLLVCFTLLFGLARLLGANEFGLPEPKVKPEQAASRFLPKTVGGGLPGIAVMGIFALAGLSTIYASPIYPSTKGHIVRENIPMSFGEWEGQNLPISDQVRDILKKGDLLSRVYYDRAHDDRAIEVFITASRDPGGFHDPRTCLPSGGSPIIGDRTIDLVLDGAKPLKVKATVLRSISDYGESIVLYWYMMGPDSMSKTSEVWRRNRRNTLRDLGRLALSPGSRRELKAQIEQRQFIWYRLSTEVLTDEETDLEMLKQFAAEFAANIKGFGK